jgi:subtilisin
MAEQKDDPGQSAKLTQSKRATQGSAATEPFAAQNGTAQDRVTGDDGSGSRTGTADKTSATVVRRKQRYLIGFRSLPGIPLPPSDPFLERLAQMDGVEITRRLRGGGTQTAGMQTAGMTPTAAVQTTSVAEIVVARMDEQRGEALRQNAPPHVIVEFDAPLGYSDMAVPEPMNWQHAVQVMPFPRPRREVRFRILGDDDRPLANAVVNLYGPGFPAQSLTDSSGHASLQTHSVDGSGIHAVYVRPVADHWERYIQNPSLEPDQVNVIRLSPLDRTSGSFPGERPYSWGQRIMKFDRISTDWNGAGTKIGIIDSGCDTSHPLLRHIVRGVDFTRDKDSQSWKSDEMGQGTHCAGIIAASALASSDMIGCAPGAEVHIFKVVPGGHFSDLIDALDQCIERRLDIVQIGVSGEHFSELVAQKITEARLNGIACIVGAGNSGNTVQFPGNVPGVMTVSAIGKLGDYPQDTRHAQRALPQLIEGAGLAAVEPTVFRQRDWRGSGYGHFASTLHLSGCVPRQSDERHTAVARGGLVGVNGSLDHAEPLADHGSELRHRLAAPMNLKLVQDVPDVVFRRARLHSQAPRDFLGGTAAIHQIGDLKLARGQRAGRGGSRKAYAVVERRGDFGRAGQFASYHVLDGGNHIAQRGVHRHVTVNAGGRTSQDLTRRLANTDGQNAHLRAYLSQCPDHVRVARRQGIDQRNVGRRGAQHVLRLLHAVCTQHLDRWASAEQCDQPLPVQPDIAHDEYSDLQRDPQARTHR